MKKKIAILVSSFVFCSFCSFLPLGKSVQAADITSASKSIRIVPTSTAKASSTLSATQIYKKITTGLEFPAQVTMNVDMFKDQYKINRTYLKSYLVKMPMISAHSNEIAVFQVKNRKYMNKVLPKVKNHLKTIQNNAFYPEQVALAKQGKVVTKGNYILLVIDENADKIINTFKKTVK